MGQVQEGEWESESFWGEIEWAIEEKSESSPRLYVLFVLRPIIFLFLMAHVLCFSSAMLCTFFPHYHLLRWRRFYFLSIPFPLQFPVFHRLCFTFLAAAALLVENRFSIKRALILGISSSGSSTTQKNRYVVSAPLFVYPQTRGDSGQIGKLSQNIETKSNVIRANEWGTK